MDSKEKRYKQQSKIIGKDEMNLLEYCIFSATNRVDRKTKSLVFEDPVHCNIEHRKVTRRLTVAFSAEYGRPTSRDDALFLAMMKKSRDDNFESQRVYFTRYELLRILGWAENGQNYQRIDDGFNRIIGSHLVWDNAFWDNEAKSWVDRKFSIIDDVHLFDRDKWDRARQQQGERRPQSWFKWSDVMFESFQAGYIKSVDLEILRNINENVGKRLYRWLDKHFNNKKRRMPVEIPIAKLATQKLGFQSAPASHLQRMLTPAIKELEAMSYLAPEITRFEGRGKHAVVRFRPAGSRKTTASKSTSKPVRANVGLDPLAQQLVDRGMNLKSAQKWAREEPKESVFQIEHLDRLLASGWKPKSGTGAWLNAAISGSYEPPPGLKTKQQRKEELNAKRREQAAQKAHKRKAESTRQQAEQARKSRVAEYLSMLPPPARQQLEQAAIDSASDSFRWRLEELQRDGDSQIVSFYREKLICDYVEQLLEGEALST